MSERFGFLIVPDFPFYGLFPAIEALRVANHNSGQRLYEWHLVSVDGGPITATNGMTLAVDHSIADCPKLSVCFAVAGNHPLDHCSPGILNWLRQIDRHGTKLGAFDSGIFLLAAAGLLDGQDAAVHWEIAPTLREHYPAVSLTDRIYQIDDRRLTCAGGSSTLDLMLTLISTAHGRALMEKVANGLVHYPHRSGAERQLPDEPSAVTKDSLLLKRICVFMSENIDDPQRIENISVRFGMNQRKLESLFKKNLNVLPSDYYISLRMDHAREYLFYSSMSVKEIALACGFSSPSVFCRAFKKIYRISPREYRRSVSAESLRRFSTSYDPGGRPKISHALDAVSADARMAQSKAI
ncbi:GlxA family transcriptional regulator [Mesorhizobium sp. M0800]|uniref:GlxA family transcriptional regulator n=1 Tax=Mesorhizobium sp. M0800 TaxID=2957000 RepID=UPI00333530CA